MLTRRFKMGLFDCYTALLFAAIGLAQSRSYVVAALCGLVALASIRLQRIHRISRRHPRNKTTRGHKWQTF
ncbi:MAG: hypothetical protein ACRC9V_07795 [Aeromonas sp.]